MRTSVAYSLPGNVSSSHSAVAPSSQGAHLRRPGAGQGGRGEGLGGVGGFGGWVGHPPPSSTHSGATSFAPVAVHALLPHVPAPLSQLSLYSELADAPLAHSQCTSCGAQHVNVDAEAENCGAGRAQQGRRAE